jgi:signal transduction histidine kinase
VDLRVSGDCHGSFDGKRVQQLLGNLIINAITHGRADAPVRVTVDCRESAILIEVSNQGPPIPRTTLEQILEPLKRGAGARDSAGLGLGLYIVSQIAKAHGGDVQARSDDDETVFSVRLPRFPNSPG